MTFSVWIALVGGIIIGWLIEWLVDWFYWRRGLEAFYVTEQQLRGELSNTQQELADAKATVAALTREVAALRAGKPYPPDVAQDRDVPSPSHHSRPG
jgi:hypothetical protein